MAETTNDGDGRTHLRGDAGEAGQRRSLPAQRTSGPSEVREVLVGPDDSDASLDRVVAAAREAQAAGTVLHLRAAPEVTSPGGRPRAGERLAHRLDLAAQVARALCPDLEVKVTGPGGEGG